MLILNLAEPDWISILCDEKLLCDIVCYKENVKGTSNRDYDINRRNVKDYSIYSAEDIIINEICYVFTWINNAHNTRNLCKMPNSNSVNKGQIVFFNQFFMALSIGNQISVLLVENDENSVMK